MWNQKNVLHLFMSSFILLYFALKKTSAIHFGNYIRWKKGEYLLNTEKQKAATIPIHIRISEQLKRIPKTHTGALLIFFWWKRKSIKRNIVSLSFPCETIAAGINYKANCSAGFCVALPCYALHCASEFMGSWTTSKNKRECCCCHANFNSIQYTHYILFKDKYSIFCITLCKHTL